MKKLKLIRLLLLLIFPIALIALLLHFHKGCCSKKDKKSKKCGKHCFW